MNFEALKSAFESVGSAISTIKGVKDLMPNGEKKKAAEKAIEQAESQLKIAGAQAANELGFPICKCAFPPNVMLSKDGGKNYKCPACGYGFATGPIAMSIGRSSKFDGFL